MADSSLLKAMNNLVDKSCKMVITTTIKIEPIFLKPDAPFYNEIFILIYYYLNNFNTEARTRISKAGFYISLFSQCNLILEYNENFELKFEKPIIYLIGLWNITQ